MSGSQTSESCAGSRLDAGYLHGLFHGAGLAVLACEPNGTLIACNPAGQALFNVSDPISSRRHVAELFGESDRQAIVELVCACVQTLTPREHLIALGRDEIGPREFAIMATPVVEAGGELRGVALWLRDITERRRLQRKLKKNERLTYLGNLAGAVAHHYNNLLCSIATGLEYAMNMNTMAAMRRATQRAAEAVGRAAQVTRQLLAFARADYTASGLADVSEIFLDYFAQIEPLLARRQIRLELEHQPVPRRLLPREHLIMVLQNLVNNAVEAMPGGGRLVAALAPLGSEIICLSITDTGSGISPQDMEHLFEPFYTTKGVLGAGQSTNPGLGLAVAYGLVSEMRGTITAANVPGAGARFDILLAVEPADAQAERG